MPRSGPIEQVVVAGGGMVGWSAAAALKRRVPALAVTIVPLAPPADALADRIAATLPSILGFHRDLGLADADAIVRTGAAYRLGTRFTGWTGAGSGYVHGYGSGAPAIGGVPFPLLWLQQASAGAAPFDRLAPAAALGAAGRLAPPGEAPTSPLAGIEPGLTLDLPRYAAMLRAFAQHCGVAVREASSLAPTLAGDGFIDSLALDDGSILAGDLFIDATGPRALLRSAIDQPRDDWRRWLPCDRVQIAEAPPPAEPPLLDEAVAHPAGWRWRSAGLGQTTHGIAYAAAAMSDAAAGDLLGHAADPVMIAAGTRPAPWRHNCVAIGDAATTLEPLEWTGLHLAHSAIDRIVAMLPARDCAPVELAEYNRQTHQEAERVRDFAALHYALSNRAEPFWRDIAATSPPASLAHSLALFRERGKLPVYDEETFARDSWLAVLIGQGVRPRRLDPVADTLAPADAAAMIQGWQAALDRAVAAAPTHAAFLAAQKRHLIG